MRGDNGATIGSRMRPSQIRIAGYGCRGSGCSLPRETSAVASSLHEVHQHWSLSVNLQLARAA